MRYYVQDYLKNLGFRVSENYTEVPALTDAWIISHTDPDFSLTFKWRSAADNPGYWKYYGPQLRSVLLRGSRLSAETIYDEQILADFIRTHFPNLNASEKMEALLGNIYDRTEFDGQPVAVAETDKQAACLYLRNKEELQFYLQAAVAEGGLLTKTTSQGGFPLYGLTVKGLTRLTDAARPENSRVCFVAMAYTPEMLHIYESAIGPAIKDAGFEPLLISKADLPADQTINDAMLAAIKNARFTVADFTGHRKNVYFEAGYALGRGQKVIYTCKEGEWDGAEFDTRSYQHILWTSATDLKKQLAAKIEVFVKD